MNGTVNAKMPEALGKRPLSPLPAPAPSKKPHPVAKKRNSRNITKTRVNTAVVLHRQETAPGMKLEFSFGYLAVACIGRDRACPCVLRVFGHLSFLVICYEFSR